MSIPAAFISAADGLSIQIGKNSWHFGLNFLLYLLIAAIIGFIAEAIIGGRRVPFGIVGAIIAGVIGVWLMTQVIVINNLPDFNLFGVPLIRALIGAIIFVAIWHLLTLGFGRRRRYREA